MKPRGAKHPAFIDQLKGGAWSRKTAGVRQIGPPVQRQQGYRPTPRTARKFGRKG